MEKVIKNCRGVKKCNDSISRTQKENRRKDFRIILGFKKMKYMNQKNAQ